MRARVDFELRVEERHRPGRLDHPAHQMEAIADHRARGLLVLHGRYGRVVAGRSGTDRSIRTE